MIALACDHTGIELKKEMMKLLDSMGLEWKDFGTDTAVSCDYPVYGYRAAKAVASGECDRGIRMIHSNLHDLLTFKMHHILNLTDIISIGIPEPAEHLAFGIFCKASVWS